jgi:putative transposase
MDRPPMKTLERHALPGVARFLTCSCYRRLRLFAHDKTKDAFVAHLTATLAAHDVRLLAWVIMPEHVHLVVYPADPAAVPAFLRTLKRPFARKLLDHWRLRNHPIITRLRDRQGDTHFWQPGGGYDRDVVGDELLEKIRYTHANPVTRGLAPNPLAWKWSSAAAYHDPAAPGPPIAFDLIPRHTRPLI